jgi:hypothetical protein
VTATRTVVVIYSARPPEILPQAIATLRGAGVDVTLIGPPLKGYQPASSGAATTVVVAGKTGSVVVDPANRPARWTPRWASIVARNLWRKHGPRALPHRLGPGPTWWRSVSSNREAMRHLAAADVLTALDPAAVYVVWKAARANPSAAAINGIQPTLEHFKLG